MPYLSGAGRPTLTGAFRFITLAKPDKPPEGQLILLVLRFIFFFLPDTFFFLFRITMEKHAWRISSGLSFAYLSSPPTPSFLSSHRCSPNLASTPHTHTHRHPFTLSQGKLLKLATGTGVIKALMHPTVWIAFQLQQ